jgi:hypothetical protein
MVTIQHLVRLQLLVEVEVVVLITHLLREVQEVERKHGFMDLVLRVLNFKDTMVVQEMGWQAPMELVEVVVVQVDLDKTVRRFHHLKVVTVVLVNHLHLWETHLHITLVVVEQKPRLRVLVLVELEDLVVVETVVLPVVALLEPVVLPTLVVVEVEDYPHLHRQVVEVQE